MASLAGEIASELNNGNLEGFGSLLNKNWTLKKKLASSITNPIIEAYYNKALKAGADWVQIGTAVEKVSDPKKVLESFAYSVKQAGKMKLKK